MNVKRVVIVMMIVGMCSVALYADTIFGPVYPAPGGNTYSAIGDPIHGAGGQTASYGGFDPTAYGQLWWTITDVANPYDSSFSGPTGNMAFTSYSGGVAEWDSTVNLTFYDPLLGQNISFPTRFLLTVSGATYDTTAATPGWLVSGPFSAIEQIQGNYNGSGWIAVGDLYDEFQHECGGGCLQTGFDGGFYYTAAATTPEPGTLALVGTGAIGIFGFVRRKFLRT